MTVAEASANRQRVGAVVLPFRHRCRRSGAIWDALCDNSSRGAAARRCEALNICRQSYCRMHSSLRARQFATGVEIEAHRYKRAASVMRTNLRLDCQVATGERPARCAKWEDEEERRPKRCNASTRVRASRDVVAMHLSLDFVFELRNSEEPRRRCGRAFTGELSNRPTCAVRTSAEPREHEVVR